MGFPLEGRALRIRDADIDRGGALNNIDNINRSNVLYKRTPR